MRSLSVYIEIKGNMRFVGQIQGNSHYDAKFAYAQEYLALPDAVAISVSLPLDEGKFDEKTTRKFFAGLLPEGFTKKAVAGYMQLDENDYISMLAALGQECLGAIKIIDESGREAVSGYKKLSGKEVVELAREGVTKSIQLVAKTHLSLTGASGKVGLYYDKNDGNWYLPKGDAPSTHIVKQSHIRLNKLVLNEQLSMLCAKNIGIDVPESFIINLGAGSDEEVLFASARYDRDFDNSTKIIDGRICPFRLHQEDFAQAMGIASENKYEEYGQEYMVGMFEILRKYSSNPVEDQMKLWDRNVFNFLIGNTDAHIKNFSLLYSPDLKGIRLAPAYDIMSVSEREQAEPIHRERRMAIVSFACDIVSTCVYKESTKKMAFAIGESKTIDEITRDSFVKAAIKCGLGEKLALKHFDDMYDRFYDALKKAADELAGEGFKDVYDIYDRILLSGGYGKSSGDL
jgi:serine/threonine-protein kinase HipA